MEKSLWIPSNLHRALKRLAFEEEKEIKELAAIAIREYLERQGCEIPATPAEPALVS